MNKKGFTIIETIIVIAMMTCSLTLIYSSYSSLITYEKTRIYYDDVADIYVSDYIKNFLLEYSDYENFIDNNFSETNKLIQIGYDVDNLFYDSNDSFIFKNLFSDFEIIALFILNVDYEIISNCSDDILYSESIFSSNSYEFVCQESFGIDVYPGLMDYIRSLGANTDLTSDDYLLIIVLKDNDEDYYRFSSSFLGSFV